MGGGWGGHIRREMEGGDMAGGRLRVEERKRGGVDGRRWVGRMVVDWEDKRVDNGRREGRVDG